MRYHIPSLRIAKALVIAGALACGDSGPSQPTPVAIAAVAGTVPQTAVAGTVVPTPPSVRVVDAGGAGVAGIPVTFAVTAGGGTVSGGETMTNANGVASVTSWTLGAQIGTNVLTAQVANLAPVTFTATGIAGVATRLVKTGVDQSPVVGSTIVAPPGVMAQDANGNPVAGVSVSFAVTAGGGAITNATASTATNGIASFGAWTIGTRVGANSVVASAPGLASLLITLTSVPGAAATLTVTPDPTVVSIGRTLQLSAMVADQYGNTIPNPPLSYAVGNAAIASVTPTGTLTGVTLGSTAVGITSGTLTKQVPVLVTGGPITERTDVPEQGQPFGVGISNNGVVLVGEPSTNKVGRYDLPSLTLKGAIAVGVDPADIAFSPDGSTAYVTNVVTATLSVVNVATNTETAQIPLPGPAYRVAAAPDGSKVYVTTANGYLATVSVPAMSVTSLAIGGTLNGMALHPTQPLLYVSATQGSLTEVNLSTGQMRTVSVSGTAQEVVVSSEGSLLYVANESGPLEVRSTATLAVQSLVPAATGAFGAAISPDNALLYVSQSGAGKIVVLDRSTMTVLRTFAGGSPRRIAFDRGGTTAAIANEAGYVTFIR